jgi:hypothetical protein
LRAWLFVLLFFVVLAVIVSVSRFHKPVNSAPIQQPTSPPLPPLSADTAPIKLYARNVLLRRGPEFKVYLRFLSGQMTPASRGLNPSLDHPQSFYLDIQSGVMRANVGDINHFLNVSSLAGSPLKNINLSGDGNQIKLNATLQKVLPLPIELLGTLSAAPGNNIRIDVRKISVLKIPFKAIMRGMHITVADFFKKPVPGISVSGNTIVLDTQQLLPPPHIRGPLTAVRIVNPDLEEVYGRGVESVAPITKFRNFLSLREGSLDFGRLTMHHVDLTMIDTSSDAWFDLDLANYARQLVYGYTRITPDDGLEIYMPDLAELLKRKDASKPKLSEAASAPSH